MWRERTDQELRELYKELDIVPDVKETAIDWTCSKNGSIRNS
jgi:hypothetical protein